MFTIVFVNIFRWPDCDCGMRGSDYSGHPRYCCCDTSEENTKVRK